MKFTDNSCKALPMLDRRGRGLTCGDKTRVDTIVSLILPTHIPILFIK